MSKTPRTDAAEIDISSNILQVKTKYVRADFAQKLELELDALKAILADPVAVNLNMRRGTIAWDRGLVLNMLGIEEQNTGGEK